MQRVFVSHPYSDNPIKRREQNRNLIDILHAKYPDILFFSPVMTFDYFDVEEQDEGLYDEILEFCQDIIACCDELWSYGNSRGCTIEREYAESIGMKIERKKL